MIDHTNIDIAIEVLSDVSRDFPVLEREQSYADAILNIVARRVRYTLETLQDRYNELADDSINKMHKDYKAGEELRDLKLNGDYDSKEELPE